MSVMVDEKKAKGVETKKRESEKGGKPPAAVKQADTAAKKPAEKPKAVPAKKPAETDAKPKDTTAPATGKETPKDKKAKPKDEKKPFLKESIHVIPLRNAFNHPKTKRAKYALREIKDYLRKHTRKEPVISDSVNKAIWAKGIQNPPRRIKVKIQEEEDRAIAVLP